MLTLNLSNNFNIKTKKKNSLNNIINDKCFGLFIEIQILKKILWMMKRKVGDKIYVHSLRTPNAQNGIVNVVGFQVLN